MEGTLGFWILEMQETVADVHSIIPASSMRGPITKATLSLSPSRDMRGPMIEVTLSLSPSRDMRGPMTKATLILSPLRSSSPSRRI